MIDSIDGALRSLENITSDNSNRSSECIITAAQNFCGSSICARIADTILNSAVLAILLSAAAIGLFLACIYLGKPHKGDDDDMSGEF